MSVVQFQFSRQVAVSSHFIAWFSHGEFSHVDAVLSTGELLGARGDCVGGKPSGVQVRPKDYAQFDRRMQCTLWIDGEKADRLYNCLRSQLGKPYDNAALWGFASGRDWREEDSWICSELQARALEVAGIVPKLQVKLNKITPVDLLLLCNAVGGQFHDLGASSCGVGTKG